MMMAPLFHEANARHPRRTVIAVLFIGAVVGTAAFYTDLFRNGAMYVLEPILLLRAHVVGDTTIAPIQSYASLAAENDHLREELALAELTMRQAEALRFENDALRSELAMRVTAGSSIRATILRRPPETRYDTMLIAAGRVQGIETGFRTSAGAAFLGRVVSVGEHVSTVVLASAPGEETRGFLLNGTSTHPLRLIGLGQGAFESSLPRSVPVAPGDSVYVFTDEWEVIGIVASVNDTPTDALLRVALISPVNMWHIRSVDSRPYVSQ